MGSARAPQAKRRPMHSDTSQWPSKSLGEASSSTLTSRLGQRLAAGNWGAECPQYLVQGEGHLGSCGDDRSSYLQHLTLREELRDVSSLPSLPCSLKGQFLSWTCKKEKKETDLSCCHGGWTKDISPSFWSSAAMTAPRQHTASPPSPSPV